MYLMEVVARELPVSTIEGSRESHAISTTRQD